MRYQNLIIYLPDQKESTSEMHATCDNIAKLNFYTNVHNINSINIHDSFMR